MSCRLGWENNESLPCPLSYHPWFAEHLMYKGETVIRTAYHQVWMGVLTIVYFHDPPLPIGNTRLYISSELGDQLLKSLKFTTSWAVVFVPPPKWILVSTNILNDELMSFLEIPMDASLIAMWWAFHQCLWFSPDAWWPPSTTNTNTKIQSLRFSPDAGPPSLQPPVPHSTSTKKYQEHH